MEWYLLRMWLTKGKNFKRYQKVHVSGLDSRVSSDVSKIPSRDQREQLSQVSKRITRCNLRIQTKILRNVNSILSLTPSTKAPCESAHSFSPLVSKTINRSTGTGITKAHSLLICWQLQRHFLKPKTDHFLLSLSLHFTSLHFSLSLTSTGVGGR